MGKTLLRRHYRKVIDGLGKERREEARQHALAYLELHLSRFQRIVSFMSLPHELDLSLVNDYILQEKTLLLPRLSDGDLEIYEIKDLSTSLIKGKKSILEPDPFLCKKTNEFDCILVPGLVFDERGYRIGYGLGCYDKLLAKKQNVYTIGIGFREQLSNVILPVEAHDKSLSELCLL